MTTAVSQSPVTSSTERFTGRVKWFNNKAGYGFITVTDGPKSGTDIFVHHSSINVSTQQYKYLVQGEYVEFALSSVSTGDHEIQSSEVSGIKGGKLMCETRHELLATRTNYKVQDKTQPESDPKTSDNVAWTPARKPRSQQPPSSETRTPTQVAGGRGSARGPVRGGRGGGRGVKKP